MKKQEYKNIMAGNPCCGKCKKTVCKDKSNKVIYCTELMEER